jgi:hypothetical protein
MSFRPVVASLLLAVAIFMPAVGLAQSDRGNITGTVRDNSKGVIPGATVKVVNVATNATTELVTSESGSYTATNLPPGTYKVEASLTGFRTAIVDKLQLAVGATATADVTLDLGSVSETVTVEAKTQVVETSDAKVSTNMPNQLIDQLPLVVGGAMRSVFDLVSTIPETKGSGNAVSLGGGQGGAFGASLDGVSVNTNRAADTTETAFLTPSVEAITEFSVETNGFKPEYGQAGGGGITFASKSGTNRYTASVYEFYRNDALDSKGVFEKQKGDFKQHNYGAAGGGPIKIPGLYDGTNKSFFFVSYEGFRNIAATNGAVFSVPTPEMLNGDFSQWVNASGKMIQLYDPATTRANPSGTGYIRDPFVNNQIPVARFSKVAQQYIALIRQYGLKPNNGAAPGTLNYVQNNYTSTGGTSLETTNKFSVKLDHTLNNSNRISFLFNRASNLVKPGDAGPAGLPVPFNTFQQSSYDADLYRGGWDWNSAKMVNRLTIGLNTFNKDSFSVNVGQDWKNTVCIPNAVDCNVNMGRVTFTEFSPWGGLADNGTEQPRFTIKDDFSVLMGAHMIKSGFIFDRQQANGFGQQNIAGQAGFDYRETSIPGATTIASGGGGSFASFVLGAADTGATETVRYLQQVYPYYAGYLQDDWKVNSKLSVNYGVRYEYTAPSRAGGDKYSDLDPNLANPAVNNYPGALLFAGEGEGRTGQRSFFDGFKKALAPRVSAAYSLNEKTTFRAGLGRSFGRVTVTQGSSHYSGFIGQYAFASADSGVTPAYWLDAGFPSYPLPPQINPAFANNTNVDWFNGNEAARPAVYDTWTASVQREVFKGLVVELDYNGSHGTRLQANLMNPNQVSMDVVNAYIAQYGAAATAALLNSQITSAAAVAAGIKPPYANFTDPKVQQSRTVAQALRKFPQYLTVDVQSGGGDKTGHSWYNAGVVKVTQRMRNGLAVQASYTYSHLMTDADSFSGSMGSIDAAQPGLEYSIGRYDQPHNIKANAVWELPFGEGRKWAQTGIANQVVGGWRVSFSASYSSGYPIAVTSNQVLNIFAKSSRPNTTGQDWRASIAGDSFDPAVDKYLNAAAFVQPVGTLGNSPRTNRDVRLPWNLNENISLAKTFKVSKSRLDFRVEAFNLFNRVVWGTPVTNFSSSTFGVISSQANSPRRMQLGLKWYW